MTRERLEQIIHDQSKHQEPTEDDWEEFRVARDAVVAMPYKQVRTILNTEHDEVFEDHWTQEELRTVTKYLSWIKEGKEWVDGFGELTHGVK